MRDPLGRHAPPRRQVEATLAGRLNYAQCWEDPRLLTAALDPRDREVLSIASAGDNAIALALAGARRVVAVDVSEAQLALCELKLAGHRLHHLEFRQLLGLDAPGRRVFLYHGLRPHLSDRARRFWDAHEDTIRAGILGAGRFEKYLELFRRRVLPLVHRRRDVERWFDLPDPAAQPTYFRETWDTWRWRTLFRLFFSQRVMAARGRSPEQFAHVTGSVANVLLERARRVLCDVPLADNGYVQWMLLGRWARPEALPPYLTPEGHSRLAEVAERVELVHGPIHEVMARGDRWSAFNLSDLPEYLSEADTADLYRRLLGASTPGARIAYWNLFVPRQRPESLADAIAVDEPAGEAAIRRDRAFVYGAFRIEEVR